MMITMGMLKYCGILLKKVESLFICITRSFKFYNKGSTKMNEKDLRYEWMLKNIKYLNIS